MQRAGRQAVVDGVEHQQIVGRLDMLHEIQPLGAAIHDLDAGRRLVGGVERFHRAHAEALVAPQDVADAEHQHARARPAAQSSRSSRNCRSPEIMVAIMVWRDMISSRTAA